MAWSVVMTTTRLKKKYDEEIRDLMLKDFGYANPMQVPKLTKITVNMGLGEAVKNPKIVEGAVEELALITGQRPVVTKARKSIATFKLREGMPIGAMVTLRRTQMYEFLDRLLNISLPRVRDFKGVSSKAFDGRGNYSLGIREQIIFPELSFDQVSRIAGLNISIVTTANTDDEARKLLTYFGMPFRK
jgi:large subunit ribosomal protein L5